MTSTTDITFMGHMCYDEIHPFGGDAATAPGSAVLCGAMAAARVGANVTIVTRMNVAAAKVFSRNNFTSSGLD